MTRWATLLHVLISSTLLAAPLTTPNEALTLELGQVEEVLVLDYGDEPRFDLKFAVQKGTTQRLQMTTSMSQVQSIDGIEIPQAAIPETLAEMTIEVVEVKDDGSFTYEMKVDDIRALPNDELPPFQLEFINAQMAPVSKMRVSMTVTSKGRLIDSTVELPDDLPPTSIALMEQMAKSFDQLVFPFPDKPVGVGAQWSTKGVIQIFGAIQQNRLFTLESFDGKVATIAVQASFSLDEEQVIELPDLPEGFVASMAQLDGEGASRMRQVLSEPTPSVLDASTTSENEIVVSNGDFEQRVLTIADVELRIGSAPSNTDEKPVPQDR